MARKLRGVPLDVHVGCSPELGCERSLSSCVSPSVLQPHAPSDSGSVGAEGRVTDVDRAALDELEKRRKGSTTGVSVVTIGCFWTTVSDSLMPRMTRHFERTSSETFGRLRDMYCSSCVSVLASPRGSSDAGVENDRETAFCIVWIFNRATLA